MSRTRGREPPPTTLDEFVVWREKQPERWEFIDGEPVMKAPGSRWHAVVRSNIYVALCGRLAGGPCLAYVDGIELRAFGQSALPDVVVSCTPPDCGTPVEAEPVVVVEVACKSSFARDMSVKWEAYRLYDSLRHYLVVHPCKHAVILHHRQASDNFVQLWIGNGIVELPAIDVSLALDDIFKGVPPEPAWRKLHA